MSKNHLIIGLGGTGGKVIRALRRAIYEEFRDKVPKQRVRNAAGTIEEKDHPVKLAYLYVDSDNSLMGSDDPTWKVPGDTLQLGLSSQLLIRGANLLNVMENLSAYPNISPWIGPREQWRDILTSIVGEALGGQKRRLGRFLLACKTTGPDGFVEKIKHQVAELKRQTGESAITFHICTGLAGGTGSGGFVDVVSQIRTAFDRDEFRILLYALLPDSHPPARWDTGNYHSNGYGGLIELNALCVGGYHPHDIAGNGSRLTFRSPDGTPLSPVNGCYIFSNENENGKVLNLERDEVSQLVASFLFQKIIVVNDTEWSAELRRAENAENGDGTPESAPGTKVPERSKRFLTFGIKRLVIPEEEIREYLAFQFARQATLQLQYNNWSDTQRGFLDEPTNEAFAQYVSDARNYERWSLSPAHLCLEAGILPLEIQEKWQPIETEWNHVVTKQVQVVMKSKEPAPTWMGTLTKMCEEFFSKRWRGKGVQEFYKMKVADLPAQAAEIVHKLERDLYGDWISGRRAMFDLGKIISELQKVLRDQVTFCLGKQKEFQGLVENDRAGGLADNIRRNNKTWADIGVLADMFGKRERTLQGQAENFKAIYGARHRVEAWSYAAQLLNRVLLELEALASTVAANISLLNEMVHGETTQQVQNRFVGLKERIEARCKDEGEVDLNDQVIKFYKVEQVRQFNARLISDTDIQHRQATAVRNAMAGKLGENPTLAKFNQRLNKGVLLDLLETVCTEEAKSAHNQIVAEDPRTQRILGTNIVDKLYRDYSGNAMALRAFIKNVVERAGVYLHFDEMEMQNNNPGASPEGSRRRVKGFAVIIPPGQEHPQFAQELQEAFRHAYGADISFIDGAKGNEISIISVANLFPLRYARETRFLKQKYDQRLASFERAKLEVHTEGEGKHFPSVFLVSEAPILPLLLLGKAMKFVHELEDPTTGLKGVYLIGKDGRGRDSEPLLLGMNDEDVLERKDMAQAYRLRAAINDGLQGEYLHRAKRDELIKGLDAVLAAVAQRIPNPLDSRRKAYKEAVSDAEQMLT